MPTITFYFSRSMAIVLAIAVTLFSTYLLGDKVYPIGWNYIALFALAAIFTFTAKGTYLWIFSVWLGALFALAFSHKLLPSASFSFISTLVVAVQYMPAAISGGLLGQWLRFHFSSQLNLATPQVPTSHTVLLTAFLLVLLPVLSFSLLAGTTIDNQSPATLLMFVPGNTPFLFPSLITAVLCGYWLRKQNDLTTADKKRALVVIIIAYTLIVITIMIKFIFGWLALRAYPG